MTKHLPTNGDRIEAEEWKAKITIQQPSILPVRYISHELSPNVFRALFCCGDVEIKYSILHVFNNPFVFERSDHAKYLTVANAN